MGLRGGIDEGEIVFWSRLVGFLGRTWGASRPDCVCVCVCLSDESPFFSLGGLGYFAFV